MYCIDLKSAGVSVHNSFVYNDDYSALDLIAVPCGTELEGDVAKSKRDDCVWDKEIVFEYLKMFRLNIVTNQGVFLPNEFGDSRIEKKSVLNQIYVNPT